MMSLHTRTPSIAVTDARGLVVRQLALYRRTPADPAEVRVNHHVLDLAAREIAEADPRLFAAGIQNVTRHHSLTGQALRVDSVDAGWQAYLHGADGLSVNEWNARGYRFTRHADNQGRLISCSEEGEDESPCVVERLNYGDAQAGGNSRGRLVRHDHLAGTQEVLAYGLMGQAIHEQQRFLASLEAPDWPEDTRTRDDLLEQGSGFPTLSRFDATSALIEQVDAAGHSHVTLYDRAGHTRKNYLRLTESTREIVVYHSISYDAYDRVIQQASGNAITSSREYDAADGQLKCLKVVRGEREILQALRYEHDPVGNITAINDEALPVRYFRNQRIDPISRNQYDSLYQLIEASGYEAVTDSDIPGQSRQAPDPNQLRNYVQHFDYDRAGNLLSRRHDNHATLQMAIASTSNRSLPQKEDGSLPDDTAIQAAFDARGNQRELLAGQHMTWDARDQLAQVTQVQRLNGTNDVEAYRYDADGQRIRKSQLQQLASRQTLSETRYLPGLELHSNSATGEQWQVVHLAGGWGSVRLLHWSTGLPTELENDQLRFDFADHLGSSVLELDASDALIGQEHYYPYGGTAWCIARSELEDKYRTIRYSGKERDATGLVYYGFRYYAPWLQRWLNPDPAGVGTGLAMYGFVGNSPITNKELDGRVYEGQGGIVEQAMISKGKIIRYRGRDAMRPEQKKLVEDTLFTLFNIYSSGVYALDNPTDETRAVLEDFFFVTTENDRKKLRTAWTRSRDITGEYLTDRGEGKFLAVQAPKGSNSEGAVVPSDPHGIITFNGKFLTQPERLLTLLGHEITHLTSATYIASEGAGTVDHFYLYDIEVPRVNSLGNDAGDANLTPQEVSRFIMKGTLPYYYFQQGIAAYFEKGVKHFLAKEVDVNLGATSKVITQPITDPKPTLYAKFQINPSMRTYMGLENADSVFMAAQALHKLSQRLP